MLKILDNDFLHYKILKSRPVNSLNAYFIHVKSAVTNEENYNFLQNKLKK
ncbi:hypothetical protein BH23BAC1_BH23BAC1_01930 [soil metagenome]